MKKNIKKAFALMLVFIICMAAPALAQEKSADEIARELANPNNSLASLTFKNQVRLFAGDLPRAGDQSSYTLLFQPSFPMTLNKTETEEGVIKDMLFFRPAFPLIIDQPVFEKDKDDAACLWRDRKISHRPSLAGSHSVL